MPYPKREIAVSELQPGESFSLRLHRLPPFVYRVVYSQRNRPTGSMYVDARDPMERQFAGAYEPVLKVIVGYTNRKAKRQCCKRRRRDRLAGVQA
jgi:hypothetical protein